LGRRLERKLARARRAGSDEAGRLAAVQAVVRASAVMSLAHRVRCLDVHHPTKRRWVQWVTPDQAEALARSSILQLLVGKNTPAKSALDWAGECGYHEHSMLLGLLAWAAWERRRSLEQLAPSRIRFKLGEDKTALGDLFCLVPRLASDEVAAEEGRKLLQHARTPEVSFSEDWLPLHLAWGRVLNGLAGRLGELVRSREPVRVGDVVVLPRVERPRPLLVREANYSKAWLLDSDPWGRELTWSLKACLVLDREWLRGEVEGAPWHARSDCGRV